MEKCNAAYIYLHESDFHKFNTRASDTDGLANKVLSLQNIVLAILLCERDGNVKISMRSVGEVPVNKWCSEYFGGGGHKNASGATLKMTMSEAVNVIEGIINENKAVLSGGIKN